MFAWEHAGMRPIETLLGYALIWLDCNAQGVDTLIQRLYVFDAIYVARQCVESLDQQELDVV